MLPLLCCSLRSSCLWSGCLHDFLATVYYSDFIFLIFLFSYVLCHRLHTSAKKLSNSLAYTLTKSL